MENQVITPENKKQILKHLDTFFLFVPPQQMKKSVETILFAYLLRQDTAGLDTDFKKVVEDIWFLQDFLSKVAQKEE